MPKDEILDGSTWTDVQPQKEEILDGSTWTEVKKKDVPAPKLESGSEATISSNGQSKSKSTSASTIVSKPNPNNQTSFTVSKENSFGIPNFQIPGVQKNTFKPLTEQQKAAGKKVLGEGTTVVEQQKVKTETPETSAKKSAILKAVTGKDISYDEVSRLSDVSNTDYAGILAAQKEKQKTDNTFATNPALQEEQRQEQVKQSEFLGNREFKVNNPQANVQILEQKNPTLLKDIADKTLELDEQRTAESFNKDKPVSQRFTKPSSDVPYKPFTDYLEVDELATVSPMELYETREKESDREKQLKYFKDRGNNNIFNEYDNEQTAISYKQGELKKKYNTAVNNLKDKYGENWLYGAEQGDKDLADLISAQKGLQENYNLSRDLLKTDKYAEVNKTIQERAQRQAEIDKTAKDDTWYKFTDESNKIQNVVMNTAYGLVNDIASLPRFFNGLSGNNDFNWTDKVADATQRFTDAGMAYFNTPTDVQRDNVQDYAEVDGYRVFLDKKGNPTSLRDADNFMVNNDAKKEEIFTKYSDNKDKIKVKTDWIDGEQIMNQSSKIIGDMLVMIAEGGGISAGIKGVGKVSRSARILNLAENAKLTTSLAVISQMQNEMMNDAIDKGMSKEDAAKYSAISSTGVAAISLINPMEAQFLKNLKNVKSLASEEVASFVNGGTTLADLSKKTIGAVIGNSVPEIAEEQFFEPVLQNVVNDSYKNQVGVNEQLDQTDVLGRENLAQSVLTATTTFLPSALESSKNMNSNSIKMNILENPENWMAIIDKKKELGIIEDDIYSAEVAAMQKAKKKYDALKSEVKQSDRTKLAGLIGDKVAIESKLSDAPELKPKYENQVKEIDSKISNLTNGITEAPKIEQAGAINIQSQDFGAEAKQDAKIESAVIEIGGKIYEGKNHAEAILKAKADGQDISQVNRQAEGKFKLSDGTIVDRAEAKKMFGQDKSELLIKQDEAADKANEEYRKVAKESTESEGNDVVGKEGVVEIKNEGKADKPTNQSVTERLSINNPFYIKVEDALSKLGIIKKYNPETKEGDVVGGYVQSDSKGGFASGDMYFKEDGSISYIKDGVIVEFDKNGNVISENTKQAKVEKLKTDIEGKKTAIKSLEETRDSENFKYKTVNEYDALGNTKKVKRLKTEQELKDSTDKINQQIEKSKEELKELEKQQPTPKEEVVKEGEVTPQEGNDVVGHKVNKGTKIFRAGKKGQWFSLDREYSDNAYGFSNVREAELSNNIKLLDLRDGSWKPLYDLATPDELAIINPKEGVVARSKQSENRDKVIDDVLRRNGYDGLSITDEGENGKGYTTIKLNKDVSEQYQPTPKAEVGKEGDVTKKEPKQKPLSVREGVTPQEGNDVVGKEGEVERYSPEEASKILGTNVLPENKVKTDESQIKPVEPTNAGQELNNSTGMAGSEQNSKAVRTKSEQGKLSNEDKIQQNATTEVQKQITEVEKIISELEDNPNSPFHKLVNLDEQKQKLSELQKKEAEVKKESAQPVLPETKAQKAANPRLSFLPKKKVQAPAPKIETTPILDEIKSKNLTHVKGKNMGENQALGTFISTEKGNRYETPTQKAEQVEIDIQNPFVVDNGDFGLVDKRQEILNANRDKFDEFDTVDYQKLPAGKLTVDNLNDAGIKKLAELTTNELKSQGYDGIYFRESDTQEGELVVFDKEKVKFKGNNINLVEQSDENGSNKGKSESKGTDTKTESSGTKNTESDTKTQSETTSGNAKRVIRKVKGTPKARRKVRNPEYLKALSHQAESAEDMVLQAFIGGAKISSEIIKKLYTNSGGEVSNRIGLLNKEGFATLSEMAHSLWENQESVFGFEKFDSQEFENAIEGVLNSYSGTKAMVEDLNKRFGSDIDAKQAEEFAKWKEFEANATEEEVSEMADYMESLSEEELNRIYNDKENAFADDYVTLAEGKKPTKRTAGEINADIKIKSAELKLLEDKQSKLNAQLEKNLKENQLDLLQGAKPQSMFDDKVEQQKVAESLKNDIDKKRKEVAKLQDELDNINQGELDLKEPKDLKTDNHQVYYNGKVVDMAYIKNPKEQFKYASQRISDNLGTGGNTEEVGYVKTPEGKIFEVSRKNKSAKLLDGEKLQEAQSKFVPIPLQGKDLIGDALDRMADKIGSKKNLTQKEKTSLIKDVTDLAKGLIQEGKATLDNVIDKIKEAIKKRFPDLDENDLNDISENIKQKVLFDEAFQWYKDNDYTYEEAKKELDDNDVDYNEKDLKAIFAEKKEKSVNEKRLQNRAFDGTTDEELKSIIEDYGLTYETESQIIAEKEANDIIEEVGLERAFQAVQNGYIKGAQAAVVYAKMVDELDTKLADDKITDEERTRLKELQAYSVDIFDTEARDAGRFLAMLNRLYQKSLFTYDTMVKSATKTKGAPLTSEEKLQLKEQSEKIAEFDKKIKELEAKLDEERAQNAVKNIKALNNKPKTASFKAKAKALADKFRQLKSKPLVLKDADGNPIELTQNSIVSYNDIIELAAKAIEKTGELLDGINTALQEIKKQKWYQNLSQRDKDAVDRQVKEELLNLDTEVSDDKFKIPNSLLREIVRNGTEDIDGIVEKVLEVYGDIYPELKDDKRKVRDIITKYGETIESKEDLIGDKLALAKRIGRLLSAKDDLLSGKLPKKSGFQREKPGATERLLMQEIQQLLKNVPKSQEELDALWATALDKAKNRVKNRIEELQLAIDREERIKKSKTVQNYNDAKLDELKSQLKEKQAEYDAAFPKEKSTLSDEQRLNQLINSKKKRLAKLEQQKIDKVYEINKKDGPDKSKFPELAKQIADLDAEIKKVNDEIKADETWKAHVEKKRIELAKKANQRRIDELKRRIDEKDFIVKKNPTPIDDELKQLRREKQKVADDYELAKYKYEQENRSPTQKGIDWILDVLTLPKSLKATLDLSAPLRQGATVLLSNPQIFWNSFIKMHGQAISNNIFEKSIDNIKKSDNYDLAQDSGLQITDPNSIDDRKKDDQFSVKLANKIPLFNKLNKGSERAYSGFLNNIRFNLFEQGVKELENAGIKYEDNPKMFKALASTVNNLTGRGKSADGNVGKFLNFILFSPRMITSRVLILHDLLRTDIPFNSPSRKMAAKSLLGTAVYIGLFNLLGTIASNASGDDDDKDRKPNFNPVATDFLKVRSKQTTFDPTAGYAPLIRTAARIAAEKSINSNGRETDLSKSYGSTRFTPAFDFLENKLSPTISYLANVATHKNPDNKYESASEAEWYDYITGLVAPLQVMQVAQNFNDKDKFGKDLLEVILGLYGIGVQQYDTSSKGKNNSRSSGSSSDGRGTAR